MLAYKPGWATTKLGQTYQQTRTNFLHIELYLWIEPGAYLLATSSLTRASRLPDGATAEWGVDLLPCRGTEAWKPWDRSHSVGAPADERERHGTTCQTWRYTPLSG